MKCYLFFICCLSFILPLFTIGKHEKEKRRPFEIFISDILISNVDFTFDKNKNSYELTLDDNFKEVSITPLLNIWQHYLYNDYSLEAEIFFIEHTIEYIEKGEDNTVSQVIKDETFLKNFYVYVNKKKYNFFDLPISIPIEKNETKKITVYYDKSHIYTFKIYNGNVLDEFYLNEINITTFDNKEPLFIQTNFNHKTHYYEVPVNKNVDKLKINGKCHNSEMLINHVIIPETFIYTFYLSEKNYNNILIIECRKYNYIKSEEHKRSIWQKLMHKNLVATVNSIKKEEAKKEREEELLQKVKTNQIIGHAGIDYQMQKLGDLKKKKNDTNVLGIERKEKKNMNFFQRIKENFKIEQNQQQERLIEKQTIHYSVEKNFFDENKKLQNKQYIQTQKVIPIKNNNYIKGINRKFYFFNIVYDIPINIPEYLYNLTDGNVCYLSRQKNKQNLYEYTCRIENDEVLLFYNVDSRLFTYIIAQNKFYRFFENLLHTAIPYSNKIYLFLESYSDRKIIEIKLKKKTTIFSIVVTFFFVSFIIGILYYIAKEITKKRPKLIQIRPYVFFHNY